jgi:hypothetical protein
VIRVRLSDMSFMQRTEVWCASAGSPSEAVCRPGVRKVPMVAAHSPRSSAGTTVCPAKSKLREQICARLNKRLSDGLAGSVVHRQNIMSKMLPNSAHFTM